MAAYLITLDAETGQTLKEGANACIVVAENSADALAIAKSKYDGDSDSAWANATVTSLDAAADLEGFRLRVKVLDSTPQIDVTVTGAASGTVDSIAALAVTALNALDAIANAAYNSTTQVLTIAGAADGLGDKTVEVEFLPPITGNPGATSIPGFVGAIVDNGASGDALSVTLGADARVKPKHYGSFKTV